MLVVQMQQIQVYVRTLRRQVVIIFFNFISVQDMLNAIAYNLLGSSCPTTTNLPISHTHTHTHTATHTHTHTATHTHTHTATQTHTHTRTHGPTPTLTHTHTHTPTSTRKSSFALFYKFKVAQCYQ